MYYMKLNVQIDVSIGEDSSVDAFSYPVNNQLIYQFIHFFCYANLYSNYYFRVCSFVFGNTTRTS